MLFLTNGIEYVYKIEPGMNSLLLLLCMEYDQLGVKNALALFERMEMYADCTC